MIISYISVLTWYEYGFMTLFFDLVRLWSVNLLIYLWYVNILRYVMILCVWRSYLVVSIDQWLWSWSMNSFNMSQSISYLLWVNSNKGNWYWMANRKDRLKHCNSLYMRNKGSKSSIWIVVCKTCRIKARKGCLW